MLQLLHIENIAIIECADIEFRPGFNALTGETGSGSGLRYVHRAASLEDVFLKLTGRDLRD